MRLASIINWLEEIDAGAERRIKGLRLVASYGIAALVGALPYIVSDLPDGLWLGILAGGFALWACVSEARLARTESSRDLTLLVLAAVCGAALTASLTPLLAPSGPAGPEATLVLGAFTVGYLKRYGLLGAGIGSQFFIGQLLAYNVGLTASDIGTIAVAGMIAVPAAIIPRIVTTHAVGPAAAVPQAVKAPLHSPELAMGLQAATGAVVVVILNAGFGLTQSAWAITACAYVVANTMDGTLDRIRRRVLGTIVGVPLGLVCLPLAEHMPVLGWALAALAMIVYAMSLPERYDIACAAFAFALVVTLAASGEHSISLLAERLWQTLLGGALGLAAALLVFPLRPLRQP